MEDKNVQPTASAEGAGGRRKRPRRDSPPPHNPTVSISSAPPPPAAPRCPYLDTIDRAVLDFDFERLCSVTLASSHVYGCLVCGRFFAGRGQGTQAYLHSLDSGHCVFVELSTGRFYCLPDGYEVVDGGLDDIREALDPRYGHVGEPGGRVGLVLDSSSALSRDLFGRRYLPGYIGLNNLGKTDYVNAAMQALAHVGPVRDYFLLTSRNGDREARWTPLALRFGELMRKMWSDRRFKSNVDPHEMVQAISTASKKRFHINRRADVSEFLSWFLNNLHTGIGGTRKPGSSVVHEAFQGFVDVTTRQRRRSSALDRASLRAAANDDRLGSDDEEGGGASAPTAAPRAAATEVKESTSRTPFLMLTFDIPERPLFKDDTQGGVVIPQEPLFNILRKFDGEGGYRLRKLPDYLILVLKRFRRNNFATEKNPTIVTFPVKNLDLENYVFSQPGSGKGTPAAVPRALANKYDLVANICHDSPAEVGREGRHDPLEDGSYRCHVKDGASKQWYEMQDLHVMETMPQLIGLSESFVLVFERKRLGG